MEFHSPANRAVRAALHRHFGPSETSWMTPLERRLEELSRRKEDVEKRIYRTVFWLAACIFMVAVLISVSSFTVRLSPLTVSSIKLLIHGCCVLFVGQSGVVFVLNHQFELLSREITNVRYWREINQSADRQASLDEGGGNSPRNTSQVHQNIPNFQNLSSSQTFPNSQNVRNDSNFQNDVMNIFRIRNLLHFAPKTKHWSISSECANCGILMKQSISQCCSYGRYLGEDRIPCKNVLKRISNTNKKSEAFVKSASIWSNDDQPYLLDVSSSVESGKQRSDQLSNLICQIPTSSILRQENLSETILEGEGKGIYSPDNQQSTLTDNFCSEEVGNRSLDQSVTSEHLASSISLQSKEDDEYEHLLNITKNIWHPTCTAAYESTDPLSVSERIAADELESLGTDRLVEGMLKYVSPDFSLSSTVSESSDFPNINTDQDVFLKNLLVDKDNRKFLSKTSDASTSEQYIPSNFKTSGKMTYKTDIESFKKDDLIACANKIVEPQTSLGISQVRETNAAVERNNLTENSDDILRIIAHLSQIQFQKFDEKEFKLDHIVPTFDEETRDPIRVSDGNKVTKQLGSTVSESKDFLSINSDPHVLPVNSTTDNEVQILNSGASNVSIDQPPTPSICTVRRKKNLKRVELFENPQTDLNRSSSTSIELKTNVGGSLLTKTNSSRRLWINPTGNADDFSERKALIKISSQKSVGSSQLTKKNSARKLCMNPTDSVDEPKAQTTSMADHSQILFRNQSDDNAFDVEDHRASKEDSIREECEMQSTRQISDLVSESSHFRSFFDSNAIDKNVNIKCQRPYFFSGASNVSSSYTSRRFGRIYLKAQVRK